MKRTILVTGASSGIGRATALALASKDTKLILCARRVERLESLKKTLKEREVEVIIRKCDVRNFDECKQFIESLNIDSTRIDVLINNAGLAAGKDELAEADLSDWEQMIDTNVKGLLYISKLVVNGMIERGGGHIVNIGSIAGKETYVGGGVYCATKSAVESINETLRKELVKHGIKVSLISPGLVNTEFSDVRFKGDRQKADQTYLGMDPLSAEDIADAIKYVVDAPQHVNIADMLILPTSQASSNIVYRERS